MVDTSRISSGFDIEVLLGEDLLLDVIGAAYDSGQIPPSMAFDDGTSMAIGRPSAVIILDDDDDADIEITIPYTYGTATGDAGIGVNLAFAASGLTPTYKYLDDDTKALVALAGAFSGNPNLVQEVEDAIADAINVPVPLSLIGGDVAEVQARNVPASGDNQAAYGLYLNLDLQVASQSGAPESEFVERGDLDDAVSFLPDGRSFAVGISDTTFDRMANDFFHSLGDDDGSHPLDLGDYTADVTSVAISPGSGKLRVTVEADLLIDGIPDPHVTITLDLTPSIVDGLVSVDAELISIDTGIYGDIVLAIIGAVTGAIIGAFFGPFGILIGAGIGAVGGVIALEITEAVLADKFNAQASSAVTDAGLGDAFSAFPSQARLFTDGRDPFFLEHYDLMMPLDDLDLDGEGMGMEGDSSVQTFNEPVDMDIVDKTRGAGAGAIEGITDLTYDTPSQGRLTLSVSEVLDRLADDRIITAAMDATHIRRANTIVTDIKFQGGLDLHVAESIALQDERILEVNRYLLIHSRKAKPHYRARPNQTTTDNFESLPAF